MHTADLMLMKKVEKLAVTEIAILFVLMVFVTFRYEGGHK